MYLSTFENLFPVTWWSLALLWGFSGDSGIKNLPAMQETQVRPLNQEDPLKKVMATHLSIAWRIPWTEEPGGL